MFETLEQVDWRKHRGAFHQSAQLPGWIRQMASADVAVRRQAREAVYEEIFHQGTIYAATPHVVPFIIEMLEEEAVPDKGDLLALLWSVVESCSQLPPSAAMGSHYMRLCEAAYRSVSAGYAVYLRFLAVPDPAVRFWAVKLLCNLLEYAPRTRIILRRQFESDADTNVRAASLYALGTLAPEGYRPTVCAARTCYQIYVRDVMDRADDRLIQLAAASAWIRVQMRHARQTPETIPDRLLPIMAEALVNPVEASDDYPLEFLAAPEILWHCSRLGTRWLYDLMAMPQLDAYHVHCLAREWLDLVFAHRQVVTSHTSRDHFLVWLSNGGWNAPSNRMTYEPDWMAYHPPTPLTPGQRQAITAIVDDDRFWQLPTNLFSFFYGLPDERAALRALL